MKNKIWLMLTLLGITLGHGSISRVSAVTLDNENGSSVIAQPSPISISKPLPIPVGDTPINISPITIIPSKPDPSAYAKITVNDSRVTYVEYGGVAKVKWESNGMRSCTISPLELDGKSGEYTIQNVTSNMQLNIICKTNAGYYYFPRVTPRGPTGVSVRVLPPTFTYIKDYLAKLQQSDRKFNFAGATKLIDQAQKSLEAGKIEAAQQFLKKSQNNLQSLSKRTNDMTEKVEAYNNATDHLSKSLPVEASVADNGCSVSGTGPYGYSLEYSITAPDRTGFFIVPNGKSLSYAVSLDSYYNLGLFYYGTITEEIYALKGMTIISNIVDADGRIYGHARNTVANDCPIPARFSWTGDKLPIFGPRQ